VKAISVCVLLCLLSILAYGGISDALSGAGQPPSQTPAARSVPAPVPAPTNNGSNVAENLSGYVYLHKTRNEGISSHAAASVKACAE
jgi:hypothetical protein